MWLTLQKELGVAASGPRKAMVGKPICQCLAIQIVVVVVCVVLRAGDSAQIRKRKGVINASIEWLLNNSVHAQTCA